MGIEDDIRTRLFTGNTPSQIIREGYKKSTVYKVHNEFTMGNVANTYSSWVIENIRYNKSRFIPGDRAMISCTINNISNADLYLYRCGTQPEWLKNEWNFIGTRLLLHPREKKNFQFIFDIPDNLPLGEYSLRFGIEGTFLHPLVRETSGQQIYWSEPSIIEIKYPFIGQSVFISHSINNMSIVRELGNILDIYGIEVIIAEDIGDPGVYLQEKFERLIRQSSFFIGLLTSEGYRSEWVLHEVNYALKINKPIILLVEEGINADIPLEYISISRYEPTESIASKVTSAIDTIQNQISNISTTSSDECGGILLAALLAGLGGLFAGLALSSRR